MAKITQNICKVKRQMGCNYTIIYSRIPLKYKEQGHKQDVIPCSYKEIMYSTKTLFQGTMF